MWRFVGQIGVLLKWVMRFYLMYNFAVKHKRINTHISSSYVLILEINAQKVVKV